LFVRTCVAPDGYTSQPYPNVTVLKHGLPLLTIHTCDVVCRSMVIVPRGLNVFLKLFKLVKVLLFFSYQVYVCRSPKHYV